MCKLHAGSLIFFVSLKLLQKIHLLFLNFQVIENSWGVSWTRMGSEDPCQLSEDPEYQERATCCVKAAQGHLLST